MPEFVPGEEKKAVVEMSNPTESAFDYTAILYMGVNMVAMADKSFHLEGGETKSVEISPVVMPSEPGTYPVYLDVWSGSILLGHYKAVEDVVITSGVIIPTFLAGAILDFKWRLVSEGTWHSSPVSVPVNTPVLYKWTVRNDSDGDVTFIVGTEFASPWTNIYYDTMTFIKQGEQADIMLSRTDRNTGSGQVTFKVGARPGEITSTVGWANAQVVDSITVGFNFY